MKNERNYVENFVIQNSQSVVVRKRAHGTIRSFKQKENQTSIDESKNGNYLIFNYVNK